MDLLVLFVAASIAGGAAVAGTILWSTKRAADSAITSYFKASEYILETGDPPPEWLAKPRRRWLLRSSESGRQTTDLMARFDEMARFFEHCRFFEDEWTREQMLSQLAAIREDWQERARS